MLGFFFSFLLPRLLIFKREALVKIIFTVLLMMLGFYFIPLLKINGESYSVFKFILKGAIPFRVVALGYAFPTFLLLKKNLKFAYLSAIIYFLTFIYSFFSIIPYVPSKVINASGSLGSLWACTYFLGPLVNLLFILFFIATFFAKSKQGRG
jgi:hypothetical protein